MLKNLNLRRRVQAAAWHLLASALVAGGCAALVFWLWYPQPYDVLAGGVKLFVLVTSVDVILGPLLTLVAFNLTKTRSHLARDMATIAIMQLAALGYGLHTVYVARPVVLAAENYLFRVVAANEVDLAELPKAPEGLRNLSFTGPRLLGVRPAVDGNERLASVQRSLEGYDGGARPAFWEPYDASRERIKSQLGDLNDLLARSAGARSNIERELERLGRTIDEVGYLEVKARAQGWIVLVDRKNGDVLGFLLPQ